MRQRGTDGENGLLLAAGDARALAATMRRAATEDGLRDAIAARISPPPAQQVMVQESGGTW